jgi:hypothetical protein
MAVRVNGAWSCTAASPFTASGTANKIAKFTGTNALGNANITDDGTTITFSPSGTDKFVMSASGGLNCATDGGCDIGNGASDPRDLSLKRNLILRGSTSGGVTVSAPAVAGSNTLTLPAATDTLVGRNTTDTLANKTLTTPTIASFVNATHSHQNAAGGGQLVGASALSDYGTAFVNSITGTSNQVTASASAGAVTLSLPQSIGTGNTPQFASLALGAAFNANNGTLQVTGGAIYANASENASVFSPSGNWSNAANIVFTGGYNAVRQDASHYINFDVYNSGSPRRSFSILQNGNVAIPTQGNGLILKATDGANCFLVTVNNAGTLSTSSTTCP